MIGKQFAAIMLGVLALLASPTQAQTIKVGSKNFTEQYILAEIYAQALEQAGFKVQRKINLGITLIAHNAIVNGDIDIYPEYTGTALAWIVKGDLSGDPRSVYDQVKAYYEKNFAVTWLNPTGINNSYTIVVRQDTADKYRLDTLSSLAPVAKELVIGGPAEIGDRRDGLPGLKDVYGIEFKDFRKFAKMGLRYDALVGKSIDVAHGYSTDWQIAQDKLVVLADDKHLFPPYYLVPLIRQDTLQRNPKIGDVLNEVSAHLTNEKMRAMSKAVDFDKDEPADVAHDFLKQEGFAR